MKAQLISGIIHASQCSLADGEAEITTLLTDSRNLAADQSALCGVLFFAIRTKKGDGTRYLEDLYERGVRNFVVPDDCGTTLTDCNIWHTADVVDALQRIAAAHREAFPLPVVGITGSNGKTIVKDWLVQLLGDDRRLCVSPKSYNSQIGVPLSVWQLTPEHQMGIFEAGISEAGEMTRLQHVIQPSIGIFTNIGSAHDENFLTRGQKIAEKLQLFIHCDVLIYCADHKEIHSLIAERLSVKTYTWGSSEDCDLQLLSTDISSHGTTLTIANNSSLLTPHSSFVVEIPFTDRASQQNAMHCIALMCYLGYSPEVIADRCRRLTPVEMRLEMIEATSGCLLINDSYSLDMGSLTIALDFLQHDRRHLRHTLILSDMMQTGIPDRELYSQVADQLRQRGISRLIAIGPALCRCRSLFEKITTSFYESTEEFIAKFNRADFQSETILLKGARIFGFERIAKLLQRRSHETIMEVDLDALLHNLGYYRSLLKPTTKLMCMVKAASYGAGKVEVASALQWAGADYLTVAYADEGVELRRGGITLPIMVMNPEEAAFDDIIRYDLEPDIYSFRVLESFAARAALQGKCVPIHIELDTGMHRLGFGEKDIETLASALVRSSELGVQSCPGAAAITPNSELRTQNSLSVRGIFTHLACSEDPAEDEFSRLQISRFTEWSSHLKALLPGQKPICSILNSSGITRFAEAQMDMVRLGIGLYGISPEPEVQAHLRQVSRLVTRISQIKDIPQGESVGYNRSWVAQRPTRLAILSIGYADGLNRHLAGTGHVLVGGKEAPIVGKVCMDMCFVDVTGIDCHEGDRVVFFGDGDLLQRNAAAAGTIPYELLTSVSPRVKRVYVQE